MLREYSYHSVWVLELFRRCIAGYVSSVWQNADTVQANKLYWVVVLFSVQVRFYCDVRGCDAFWCDVVLQYVGCIFGVSVWSFSNEHSKCNNKLDATFSVLFRLVWSMRSVLIVTLNLQLRRCVVVCSMHSSEESLFRQFTLLFVEDYVCFRVVTTREISEQARQCVPQSWLCLHSRLCGFGRKL